MEQLKIKIVKALKTHQYFVFMFLFFMVIYGYSSYKPENKANPAQKMLTADTLIPKGYVLVPIELTNIQAIAGIIDGYGVIDVFIGKTETTQSKKVLNKVKILRAPLDPNSYSVLLPDALAKTFMEYSGPFFAVVQNKSETTTTHDVDQNISKTKTVKIEYNGG